RDVADDDLEVDAAAADRESDPRDRMAPAAGTENVDRVVGARTIIVGDENVVAEASQVVLHLGADDVRGLSVAAVEVAVRRREQRDADGMCGGVDGGCCRRGKEGDSEND